MELNPIFAQITEKTETHRQTVAKGCVILLCTSIPLHLFDSYYYFSGLFFTYKAYEDLLMYDAFYYPRVYTIKQFKLAPH